MYENVSCNQIVPGTRVGSYSDSGIADSTVLSVHCTTQVLASRRTRAVLDPARLYVHTGNVLIDTLLSGGKLWVYYM